MAAKREIKKKTTIRKSQLRVLALSLSATNGWLEHGGARIRCALGRTGRKAIKREGDGATPLGALDLVRAFYRPDRVLRPGGPLPMRALRRDDGWCDAAGDRNYNRPVRLPYAASAEDMWRADGLYDVVIVLDYNLRRRVRGRGSAIFFHCAKEGFPATQGCVAIRRDAMLRLLARLARGASLRTVQGTRRTVRTLQKGPDREVRAQL